MTDLTRTVPKIGSLCTGYGGLDQAAQAVFGGRLAWVSDIDPGANRLLAHRHPDVPNLGDFTRTDWSTVEPVEVVTAGFPCQPVSNAGKRKGDADDRWLWDDVARAVRDLRPRHVLLENVRGLLTAGGGRLFGRVLGTLASDGYDVRWHGLRAADIGAPHGRWRIFLLATDTRSEERARWAGLRESEPTGVRRGRPGHDPAAGRYLPTPTTRDHKGRNQRGDTTCLTGALLPTPAVNDMGEGKTVDAWDEWIDRMKTAHGNGNGHGASLAIEAQRLLPTPSTGESPNGHGRRGGSTANGHQSGADLEAIAKAQDWGRYAAAVRRWEGVTRPAPPPTEVDRERWNRRKAARLNSKLPAGMRGSIAWLHAGPQPRLSAAFSEWMMGLPEGWITDVPGLTRNQALKLAGNGVVPQQAEAALRLLLNLSERP